MIYLGYSRGGQATYALYDGTLIRCNDRTWPVIDILRCRATDMTITDQRLAHHIPEARAIQFTLKIPYTWADWRYLRRIGMVVVAPAQAVI